MLQLKKIYVIFLLINNTLFLSIHIFGSENRGQISICQIIMFYLDAFIDHVDYFFCYLCVFLCNKNCNMQYIIVTGIEFLCVH